MNMVEFTLILLDYEHILVGSYSDQILDQKSAHLYLAVQDDINTEAGTE